MSDVRKELPYLNAYLQEMQGRKPIGRGIPWYGYAGVFLAGFPIGNILSRLTGGPSGLIAAAAVIIGCLGLLSANRRLMQPRNAEERFQVRAFEALKRFQERSGPRRLRKSLHPAAAQVLEACAYHRRRVRAVLESPGWVRLASESHWRQIRDQSIAAADLAMLEAILASEPFLGKEKAKDLLRLAELAENLAKGDLDDAFEVLARAFGRDRDEDEFRDWQAVPEPLHGAYNVAVKLKKLASELELQADSAARAAGGDSSASSLDGVLHNLEQLRAAEKELAEERLRQGA